MAGRDSYYEQERIKDMPAVKAILSEANKVLPEDQRSSTWVSNVGRSIVIFGSYEGLQNGTTADRIQLGVVSPNGVPYSSFRRLDRDPDELAREVEEVTQWAKEELARMGYKPRRRLSSIPSLRKIVATLAMRREEPK